MSRSALLWALTMIAAVAEAQLPPADAPPNVTDSRCGEDCMLCGIDGCIKCSHLLIWPSGVCSQTCPSGTKESWARDDHLMGRVCYPSRNYSEVLVGGGCGGLVCLALVLVGAAYARCRTKSRARPQPLPQTPKHEDDNKLREFHKQLDCLRPHAYTLLAILNHTRSQVRELYQLGNNEAAVAYSCVLTDLAKLLILLNKQHVPVVPEEWPRLASWADRILKRYSRTTLGSNQTGPLVNIVQSPSSHTSETTESTQQSFSTFKPPSYSPSSFDGNILEKELDSCQWSDVNVTGRPPSYSQVERDTIILTDPWERKPIVRRESVWLEDEMFEMTRRPQDELTTEL